MSGGEGVEATQQSVVTAHTKLDPAAAAELMLDDISGV